MIIDTHCHLASAQFDQSRRETYVQHALREGIDRMITLGARMDDWEANTAWARQFPGAVFCALGIHPDDAHDAPADWADQLFRKAQDVPLAAIGETGLDYFHGTPQGWETEQFHRLQQDLLERHFDLAERLGLNIVLHTRDRKGSASFEDAGTTRAACVPYFTASSEIPLRPCGSLTNWTAWSPSPGWLLLKTPP